MIVKDGIVLFTYKWDPNTSGQSASGSKGSEGIPHTTQISRTVASSLDTV